jgi:cAMP-binding proteins - catabolite gene activator and regulatory subunit of cAMP-dependent protein kinases
MLQIRKYFEERFAISEEDWNIFSSKLHQIEFPKNHVILKAGDTEHYLSFIEKGLIRFYIPQEEKELTFTFIFENNFYSAYDSFLTQQPSVYQVETLAPTILWRIHYNDLQEVYKETQIGNFIGRMASEELFLKKSKRELSLLVDSAEKRYAELLAEKPELIQHIPLKYLASYIGVTPQALSRIRARIAKKSNWRKAH